MFGDRQFFCLRAVDFPIEIDRRVFDADSIDFDASIDRGAQKRCKLTLRCSTFASRNRRIAVFGDRTIFCLRAVDFSTEIERRFFDADSIDFDASIDRGARNRSKLTLRCSTFAFRNRRIAVFGDRTIFCLRAVHFSSEIDRRFFDADPVDFDASIDRGAQNRSKLPLRCSTFAFRNRHIAVFGDRTIFCLRAVHFLSLIHI